MCTLLLYASKKDDPERIRVESGCLKIVEKEFTVFPECHGPICHKLWLHYS